MKRKEKRLMDETEENKEGLTEEVSTEEGDKEGRRRRRRHEEQAKAGAPMIYGAMIGVMKDISAIAKSKTNVQQGFKFRGIEDVYNALHPIMSEHGIITLPRVLSDRTEERVTKAGNALIYRILEIEYCFTCEDGSFVTCKVIGEGMDSGDKAANKAMSIGHKYALTQTFVIPTIDLEDPDAETYDVKPKSSTTGETKKKEPPKEADKKQSPPKEEGSTQGQQEKKSGTADEASMRYDIVFMLEELWGGDEAMMEAALEAVTGFEGKNGWVAGKTQVADLKDKRNEKGVSQLTIAYGKIKAEYDEWKKGQEAVNR
jgi:hypothetical protein